MTDGTIVRPRAPGSIAPRPWRRASQDRPVGRPEVDRAGHRALGLPPAAAAARRPGATHYRAWRSGRPTRCSARGTSTTSLAESGSTRVHGCCSGLHDPPRVGRKLPGEPRVELEYRFAAAAVAERIDKRRREDPCLQCRYPRRSVARAGSYRAAGPSFHSAPSERGLRSAPAATPPCLPLSPRGTRRGKGAHGAPATGATAAPTAGNGSAVSSSALARCRWSRSAVPRLTAARSRGR